MTFPFRHVENAINTLVTLHLFTSANGRQQGNVHGPRRANDLVSTSAERVFGSTLANAFASAIRMANKNDMELVITGDRRLWQSEWGTLSGFTTKSVA